VLKAAKFEFDQTEAIIKASGVIKTNYNDLKRLFDEDLDVLDGMLTDCKLLEAVWLDKPLDIHTIVSVLFFFDVSNSKTLTLSFRKCRNCR
jgi:hypothetical protein